MFLIAIKKWNLRTPGRENDSEDETHVQIATNDYTAMAQQIIEGLGGKDNIASLDHCVTRLRMEVKDHLLVSDSKLKAAGAAGVIRPGKNSVQVVIGTKVQFVHDALRELLR